MSGAGCKIFVSLLGGAFTSTHCQCEEPACPPSMRPGAALLPPPCRHDQQQGRDVAELLSGDLSRLAPLINALFFGLVGASL